jgi:hypothetical protein
MCILNLPFFAPYLAHYRLNILIIYIDRKLFLTVFFQKIYSLTIGLIRAYLTYNNSEGANITDGSVYTQEERYNEDRNILNTISILLMTMERPQRGEVSVIVHKIGILN